MWFSVQLQREGPLSSCSVRASHHGVLSCCGAQALGSVDFSSCGTQAQQLRFPGYRASLGSLVALHMWELPRPGINPLYWQVGSLPLSHQGSPKLIVDSLLHASTILGAGV